MPGIHRILKVKKKNQSSNVQYFILFSQFKEKKKTINYFFLISLICKHSLVIHQILN